jgi:hypothetical protein
MSRRTRRLVVAVVAWGMPKIPAGQLRAAFDRRFRHRDQEWRDAVWREAAEKVAARV